ncbi:hypothetical protein [Pseudodesulfovibrio portus]|uniref:Uncharacterized protein n=1 Tax=Pseudodesulfovibrio portus TaxID=231439 RepID=A0ABN6RWV7_9BACT|nr:hypothetical protein [Pseudodesulfovibrio portus]BDQ33906.1 hypothetical protein JCM14722_14480 [Pseudodesulfovibrio portus]
MNTNIISLPRPFLVLVVSLFVLCSGLWTPAMAEDEPTGLMGVELDKNPDPLDAKVESSIDHLFEVLRTPGTQFDPARVRSMLDFVTLTTEPKDIAPARRFDGLGVCLRNEVKSDLRRILHYFYNPEIPNYLLCPAVLRMSGWHEGSEILNLDKGLWDQLENLSQPVVVRGREFESTTPDSFAEAYYLYDLNRLIILLNYAGKNVLLSVTEQEDKSDVGRKGAILDDKQWDYFYSGLEGLNRGMIGWMDTFTYASGSVQVYIEDMDQATTTVFLFKWLRAGWAGMNVVKRSHIYDGTLRYMRSFAKVVESDVLTPEQVVAGMKDIDSLTKPEIDNYIKEYAANFEARFKDNPKLEDSDYAKIIADGGYVNVLDDKARLSILSLEKLKGLLGMDTLINLPATQMAEMPAEAAPDTMEQPVGSPAETPETTGMLKVQTTPES